MKLITLFGKTTKGVPGTTYYKDEQRTIFVAHNPWHTHRTSKIIMLNGWCYWLQMPNKPI